MKRRVFAANWKMHHGPGAASEYMRTFVARNAPDAERTLLFFPPALSLSAVVEGLADRQDIMVGPQNIFTEDSGAFTGENSPAMARAAGARVALVGHSERRHIFGESEREAGLKCAAAVRAGLTPLFCVGETLEQRQAGEASAVVLRQLGAGLSSLSIENVAGIMVAYEPVWAIGTGQTATPADASEIHEVLRGALRERLGTSATSIPILYGGSVSAANAALLLGAPEVDGLLVGGASLDPVRWAEIVRS